MAAELEVRLAGAAVRLLADRAVWWPEQRAVLVADVHLGKDAVFRAHGLAVPAGSTAADLERLAALCVRFDAERLIVLGDLLHGRPDATLVTDIAAWRETLAPVRMLLVRGNHDRHVGPLPETWRMEEASVYQLGGLELVHAPTIETCGAPTMAGHLHPVCTLRDGRGDALRVPVFWLQEGRLILPAFGSFTGGHAVRPRVGDRVFAVGPGHVVEVSGN